jgi:hypothetical protein
MKRILHCVLPLVLGAVCCGRPASRAAGDAAAPGSGGSSATSPGDPSPDVPTASLERETASRLVALSLACVDREFPNKPDSVIESPEALRPSRVNSPAFFGCYDWHSSVHGHWAMLRVLGLFPDLPEGPAIRAVLDRHLSPANLTTELSFFQRRSSALLERPYGWGWLLRLATELRRSPLREARAWEAAVQPFAAFLSGRMADYLSQLSVPVRHGVHSNTAFALTHGLAYARATGDRALEATIEQRARDFYLPDTACPVAYEPSGEDFLSPCLSEADLMRSVLPRSDFARWLDGFLPPVTSAAFAPLLLPVAVKDRKDPRIGHLIGLGMQRAWSLRGVASALPDGDPRRLAFDRIGALHRQDALQQMFDSGYGGEHWLASFAIYMLSGVGIADP